MAKLVAWIGRCGNCKGCVKLSAFAVAPKRLGAGYEFAMASTGKKYASFEPRSFGAYCLCGKVAVFAAIYGETNNKRCGAACRNAKSGSCECACGGDNHGAAHAA